MSSPREGSPRREHHRRRTLWAGLAVGGLLSSIGCQVEYAGMTLPTGKYMHDDVQYFPAGPEFPWANTQAAAQRARMSVMGEAYGLGPMAAPPPGGPVTTPPAAPGALDPRQNLPGRPTDVNVSPLGVNPPEQPEMEPAPPPGGEIPPPGQGAPDLGPR